MKQHEIVKAVAEKANFYDDLVSSARKTEEHYHKYPLVKELIDRLERDHPEEMEKLQGEDGDWTHGFNSGMLAGMRYVLSLHHMGKEQAEWEFTSLDT